MGSQYHPLHFTMRRGRKRVALPRPDDGRPLFIEVATDGKARARAPWAVGIRRVENGWLAFADSASLRIYDRDREIITGKHVNGKGLKII